MRHLVYNVRYSVVSVNSSSLTTTYHSSVITTLVYNDTKYSVSFITLYPSSTRYSFQNICFQTFVLNND